MGTTDSIITERAVTRDLESIVSAIETYNQTTDIQPSLSGQVIYVLQLENNKWYVGSTTNLDRRIQEHKSGRGSEWTKLHRFISLYSEEEMVDPLEEDLVVKMTMREHGIDNVRGGSYSNIKLTARQRGTR